MGFAFVASFFSYIMDLFEWENDFPLLFLYAGRRLAVLVMYYMVVLIRQFLLPGVNI